MFDSMEKQEENTDAYVVVVGPDDRPQDQKSDKVDSHECCVFHLDNHSVFVLPKDYGIRKADVDARARARSLSEHEAIDSLKSLWGGTFPLGTFSLQEAVVAARELLNRSYVMLMKVTQNGPPRVGYLMDLVEWRSMHQTLERHAVQKPQYADGYQDQYLCRALRIQVLGKGKGVRVEPRVIDLAEKTDLRPGLCRVGTWQRQVWDETVGRIPVDDVGCMLRHRDEGQKSTDYPDLEGAIDSKTREELYLLLMYGHWVERKEPYKNIAAEFAVQFGRHLPQQRGNIRNMLGRVGCVAPSASLVPPIYSELRKAAMSRAASVALHKGLSWTSVVNDRDLALRLLAVVLPDVVGKLMLARE